VSGHDTARFRRYLLGRLDEDERRAVERQYFEDDHRLDDVAAEEDRLIEDYLADRLSAGERTHFERVYLASPLHRRRVAVVRALAAAATTRAPARDRAARRASWYAGLAAAAVVLLGVGLWFAGNRAEPMTQSADVQLPAGPAPVPPIAADPAAPLAARVFAVTLSPAVVRSGDAAAAVVIPAGTDLIALDLGAMTASPSGRPMRASVRTVTGDPIWEGAASPREGMAARIQVPASVLPPDDYIVTLSVLEQTGGREVEQYVLRVREP
jgi:hypothetical protein